MNEFKRYDEIYDDTLRESLRSIFTEEYAQGWIISSLVKNRDKWIVCWDKDFRTVTVSNDAPITVKV